jgi:hypothetical protein
MANIKFKIEELWPNDRLVVVRFFTDGFPEGSRLGVTIYPDPTPVGDELHDYIMQYAPRDWLRLKEAIVKKGLNLPAELTKMLSDGAVVSREIDEQGHAIPLSAPAKQRYDRMKGKIPPGAL